MNKRRKSVAADLQRFCFRRFRRVLDNSADPDNQHYNANTPKLKSKTRAGSDICVLDGSMFLLRSP